MKGCKSCETAPSGLCPGHQPVMRDLTFEFALYRRAMLAWGCYEQLLALAEECSELAAACHHARRDMRNRVHFVWEEIADVEIMCAQVTQALNAGDAVAEIKGSKLRRLEQRLLDAGR